MHFVSKDDTLSFSFPSTGRNFGNSKTIKLKVYKMLYSLRGDIAGEVLATHEDESVPPYVALLIRAAASTSSATMMEPSNDDDRDSPRLQSSSPGRTKSTAAAPTAAPQFQQRSCSFEDLGWPSRVVESPLNPSEVAGPLSFDAQMRGSVASYEVTMLSRLACLNRNNDGYVDASGVLRPVGNFVSKKPSQHMQHGSSSSSSSGTNADDAAVYDEEDAESDVHGEDDEEDEEAEDEEEQEEEELDNNKKS